MDRARPTERETQAFYRAALLGLRYLENQKASDRRFGPNADAKWSAFRGDLATIDRIDLMIRDADAQWPAAFGARNVFGNQSVAEDDAFGADWTPLEPVDAEDLWRAILRQAPTTSIRELLTACGAAWDVKIKPTKIDPVAAADKLVVVGPSAIAAVVEVFSDRSDLDFSDQVTVVATPPGHRQIAAIGSALLGITKAVRLVSNGAEQSPPKLRAAILIQSDDADEEDRKLAQQISPG